MQDFAWAFLSGAIGGVAVLFVAPYFKLEKGRPPPCASIVPGSWR
jgi:hypothetical protein